MNKIKLRKIMAEAEQDAAECLRMLAALPVASLALDPTIYRDYIRENSRLQNNWLKAVETYREALMQLTPE